VNGAARAIGRAFTGARAGPSGDGGLILLATSPAAFIAVLNSYALGPFFPRVAGELGVSVALLGQVPALLNGAAAVLGLAMGPLADRFGNRLLLLAGTAAAAAGALTTGLAPTFELLLVAAIFGALGRAVVAPVALAIVGARFAGPARMRAMSYVVAALSGSAILGIPALTTIAALADTWRAAFGALAAVALLTLLLSTLLLPSDGDGEGRATPSTLLGAYGPLIRHHPTLGVIGAAFLRGTFIWIFATYLGAFLIEQHGLSSQGAGFGYTAVGSGHFVGSLLAGRRLGTVPLRPVIGGLMPLAALGFTVALVAPIGPFVAIGLAACATMLLGIIEAAAMTLLITESPAGRATTMTANQSANSLGTAVGGAVGGLLLATGGYPALGLGIPVFAVVAVLLLWASRPRPASTPRPRGTAMTPPP
jgi:predicted MFS family arabinose efflux permease